MILINDGNILVKDDIPKEKRLDVDGRLIIWYYDEGGSLFLSWKATKCFLESVDMLRNVNSKSDVIRKTFSGLRTTLKRDCGIYSNFDVGRVILRPREPLCPDKVQK